MSIVLVTGSGGLIGSTAVRRFAREGMSVVGIDNNMREYFFGSDGSTRWCIERLKEELKNYIHYDVDIREFESVERIFSEYSRDISLVIHTAAQPSHDWAAKEPLTDFAVNAVGTLNLLELTRRYCPEAVFIFTSTNKVYGDLPNYLPLIEKDTRWEIHPSHRWAEYGIDESMSIDQSLHSIFGASKVAGDVMVQEYGRYFGMKTAVFRGGCLTGSQHSGAELHGFLAYLMKCALTGREYKIYGYKGKQVRDNIHSEDLVECFWEVYKAPRIAEVYNIGGGRYSNCSLIEAIYMCEEITGKKLNYTYIDQPRRGDHIWWISDIRKFQSHYPGWKLTYSISQILEEIYHGLKGRA
ncbi:MAG: NAD-dependent epimerase/dehydratase family protein [Candidatus Hydrogenedentes bacterium]|nr:NAD-dependent epimerase/dehydratase family protein [Candidatus Hydrogenedentota bacterium]